MQSNQNEEGANTQNKELLPKKRHHVQSNQLYDKELLKICFVHLHLAFTLITKILRSGFFLVILAKGYTFLEQLGCRLLHILKRLLPISVYILQV